MAPIVAVRAQRRATRAGGAASAVAGRGGARLRGPKVVPARRPAGATAAEMTQGAGQGMKRPKTPPVEAARLVDAPQAAAEPPPDHRPWSRPLCLPQASTDICPKTRVPGAPIADHCSAGNARNCPPFCAAPPGPACSVDSRS